MEADLTICVAFAILLAAESAAIGSGSGVEGPIPASANHTVSCRVCTPGWLYSDATGMCHKIFDPRSFEDARQICHNEGGELSSIPNLEANNFLSDMALKYADVYELKEPSGEPSTFGTFFWIGLYAVGDAPCRYKWPDNSTMNFENWWEGHAPKGCADMDEKTARWMDGYMASARCVAVNVRCDVTTPCEEKNSKKSEWEAKPCYEKLRAICQTAPQRVFS